MRALLAGLLALAAGASCGAAQEERIPAVEHGLLPAVRVRGRTPAMDLADRMAYYKVPGVSVAVIDEGAIAWAKGYGVREAGGHGAVDEATLFQAASISKPVTAAATLQLVRERTLDLTGDVNRWLRTWRLPEDSFTRRHPVTIEGLLSHTAGLSVHGFPGYDVDSALPTLAQVLDGAPPANTGPIRPIAVPGTAWRYSGGGYTVLQQLLIDVTRTPFPEFMRRTVLQPLEMDRSTYEQPLPARLARNAATAHDGEGRPIHGRWHVYPEMAAAGLWTTPSDLARFLLAVQDAIGGGRNRVFTLTLVADMLTPRLGSGYGLGLAVSGEGPAQRFGHGGGNEGFRCEMVAYMHRGQGAVVMTNGDHGGALAQEVLRSIAAAYGWPGYLRPAIDAVALAPPLLDELAGAYALPDSSRVAVVREGDALFAESPGGPRERLWPTSDSTFVSDQSGAGVRVERDAARRVTGVVVVQGASQTRAARVP